LAEIFLASPVLVATQNPPVVSKLVLRNARRDIAWFLMCRFISTHSSKPFPLL
jgi:hypothetical protein